MATDYYNDDSTANYTVDSDATNAVTTITVSNGDMTSTATGKWVVYYPPPRKILVETPKSWKKKDSLAFVKLLNVELKATGWRVELLITGNVLICDPNIEKRTMADFIPLLKHNADEADRKLIKTFFNKHPV